MTSLKQDDVKNLFNKEFDFVNTVLNQVKLPERVEDSGTLVQTCAFSIFTFQSNKSKSVNCFADINILRLKPSSLPPNKYFMIIQFKIHKPFFHPILRINILSTYL